MAAPIVSHIAAMIRSYFPNLSAIDVKKIIMQSVWKPTNPNAAFIVPQKEESKKLTEIASTGGIVNAANAIQMANKYTPSKNIKSKTK